MKSYLETLDVDVRMRGPDLCGFFKVLGLEEETTMVSAPGAI